MHALHSGALLIHLHRYVIFYLHVRHVFSHISGDRENHKKRTKDRTNSISASIYDMQKHRHKVGYFDRNIDIDNSV